MADKTSWTKPLAHMTYGDSIVARGRLEAGAASEGADVGRPGTVERDAWGRRKQRDRRPSGQQGAAPRQRALDLPDRLELTTGAPPVTIRGIWRP
jgi:hypothetical protein